MTDLICLINLSTSIVCILFLSNIFMISVMGQRACYPRVALDLATNKIKIKSSPLSPPNLLLIPPPPFDRHISISGFFYPVLSHDGLHNLFSITS